MDSSISYFYQKRLAFQSVGIFSKKELILFWLWKDLPVEIILSEFEFAHFYDPFHFTVKRNLNNINNLASIYSRIKSTYQNPIFIEFMFINQFTTF